MGSPKFNIDRVFHVLGDPTRRVIGKSSPKVRFPSRTWHAFGDYPRRGVQHLQILEQSGLIYTEKAGQGENLQDPDPMPSRRRKNGSPSAARNGSGGWIV